MFSAPLNVCLNITSRCNLNCKHCMNRNLSGCGSDLTTKELLNVIDQLARAKVFQVSIFGGEPLTHPDFFLIIEHLNKYPIRLSLNTNGTLIDRNLAQWLKGHNIKDVVVSFDGSNDEIMDKVRGKGTFLRNIKGIESLLTEGLSVLLSVTVTRINYCDIRAMALLAKKLKANRVRFNHVVFGGNAACFIKEIYLSPEEEIAAVNEVWQLKEEFPELIEPTSSYLSQKEKLEKVKNYKSVTGKIIIPPCGAADDRCNIRADGWVTPCEVIWEEKCGNVREESFIDIWNNKMNHFREPLILDLNELPECQNCQYQYICFIGHRCYPYCYPGGVKDRSVYCWLNTREKEEGLVNGRER